MATTAMNVSVPPPDEEEQLLAKFVFGDTTDLQENLAKFNADFIFNEQEMDVEDQEDEGSESDNSEEDEAQNGELDHVNNDQLFLWTMVVTKIVKIRMKMPWTWMTKMTLQAMIILRTLKKLLG